MEYLRLTGEMDREAVLDIAKNVLYLSDLKITTLMTLSC